MPTDTLATQSRRAIAAALLQLMQREDFGKLTILQICQEAGLSRRTFYRHFATKEAVLQHHLAELCDDFAARHTTGYTSLQDEIFYSFVYFNERRALLQTLYRHQLFYLVKEMLETYMRGACMEEYTQMLEQPGMEHYFSSYLAGSLAAVLELWVSEGFTKSPEALAGFVGQFYRGG